MTNPARRAGEPSPAAPALGLRGTEVWRAATELACTQLSARPAGARGDGHAVVIFPGLGANGASVAVLSEHCRLLGYDAFDWGQGFNTGPQGGVEAWLDDLAAKVCTMLQGRSKPASLVGWSLGGLYARELGKRLAPQLRQVITIGTPFNAGIGSTNVGWLYALLNRGAAAGDADLIERLRVPPPLPTTSIYSRSDGVVAWQACCHEAPPPWVQDIEVQGSHTGMGWNREVLQVVADRLSQAPQLWHPHRG